MSSIERGYLHLQGASETDHLQSVDHSGNLGYNYMNSRVLNVMPNSPIQPENMNPTHVNKDRKPHPSASDPLEVRIRGLIREQAYSTAEGMKMWGESRQIQQHFFQDVLSHLDDPSYIHDKTQETLRKLAGTTNAEIVNGEENARQIKTPALVVLNHYSGYKLNSLKPEDLDTDFGKMEELYPFPSFFASLVPVAQAVGEGTGLYDAHLEYSTKEANTSLRQVQEAAGLLVIPESNGGLSSTLASTRELLEEHPNSLLVVFPEGESSGKRNNGTPYDMMPFHSGAFVIAAELGIPILPAVQYFNPERGFEVSVLPPLKDIQTFAKDPNGRPTEESKVYYENLAELTHQKMQSELNKLSGKQSS